MIGDEPMQYYDKFTDITVAVCENRVNGVQRLIDSGRNPGVIIMDDGFQHRWIDPGMKLLLTPFDHLYTRDYVLPAGNLRERRTGYRRADCIIITKCDDRLTEDVKKKLVREIKPVNGQKVFFSFHTFNNPVSFFSKETLTVDQLKGKNILVFSGISNPTALFLYVKSLTTNYQVREFPDHHIYTEKDIRSLIGKFDKFAGQSVILTTEKDYQRIKGTSHFHLFDPLPCYFLPVTVRLEPSREFDEMILKYVEQHQRNRRLHQ
jgi:tetraacyldisaccharide 4'-kinase